MSRLVTVSNRLALPPGDAAPGGLAISLAGALRERGGLWFGWSGLVASSSEAAPRRHHAEGVEHAVVDLTPDDYAGFYTGYSNGVLWPLCHGFTTALAEDAELYATYREVNRRYARAVQPLLRADDTVWVHDYHLLPLGLSLRAAGATHPIGHFLHVPFPGLPAVQALAAAGELLDALLAYDLLGFQTEQDRAAFHAAARWHWGPAVVLEDGSVRVNGRRTAAGVFPLGVNVEAIAAEAATAHCAGPSRWWPHDAGGARAIGADRLDDSKGLPERLDAYERFLSTAAPRNRQPAFLQVTTPSRAGQPGHAVLRAAVEQSSARINARHADAHGDVIRCLYRALPHGELMGLLADADVGIVTPLRDGMNLLAKEFVAAQPAGSPGALVLSVHAGAARELDAAVQVDPHDIDATALAINTAFCMPLGERRERHQAMLAVLRRRDLHDWQHRFLQCLHQSWRDR